MDSIN